MFAATGNESEPSTSNSNSTSTSTSPTPSTTSVQQLELCRRFEFHEILSATESFAESSVIGRGGFGKVYKGNIKNGSTLVVAAIKRLDVMSSQGASEFWAEVEMLSKLRHCHLVSLIGYCNHQNEMILVYEYMPHGTLADHLHKLGNPLSWGQRLKMCIGTARGLDYLHSGTGIEFGIIHRDVKSSNILLDESWAAKVSDFGLSKISPKNQPSTHVSTLVKGTFGYFDPHYFTTGKLTRKSDVYAFGVILLEVLCRKRAVDVSLDCGLVTWFKESMKDGHLKDIVDPDIRGEISAKCFKQFAQIAERCLENHPKNRPNMAEVVLSLEILFTLQEKTDNVLQTTGKTIFGRMFDKFSFSDNSQNSGMDFESIMPKMPHIGMDFRSLMPKKWNQLIRKRAGSINIFRAEEIEKATMNFADNMIIGRGVHGIVYKGILPDNRVVAIKRSKNFEYYQVLEAFIDEIEILGQINHRNVVQLLGCCWETKVPLLVYEFFSSYNLYHHIHNDATSRGRLSWDIRLRIAHESASALAYLHSNATETIIHKDVKSVNILLDENYTAKVTNFDARKFVWLNDDHDVALVRKSRGYYDPEHSHRSQLQLTDKSDVYSFGVVLAELITGLKPYADKGQEDRILPNYFLRAKREDRLHEIVDRQVSEAATNEQLEAACSLVCRCLRLRGECRPTMNEVTMELEKIEKLRIQPMDWRGVTVSL